MLDLDFLSFHTKFRYLFHATTNIEVKGRLLYQIFVLTKNFFQFHKSNFSCAKNSTCFPPAARRRVGAGHCGEDEKEERQANETCQGDRG
jgi:hypothetical protein